MNTVAPYSEPNTDNAVEKVLLHSSISVFKESSLGKNKKQMPNYLNTEAVSTSDKI